MQVEDASEPDMTEIREIYISGERGVNHDRSGK
jgi:hypothetical protein